MLFAYLIAMLPAVAGAVQWATSRKVVWWEWLAGSALGFALAAIMINSMGKDVETWSGRVTHAIHHPRWHAHVTTGSKGKTQTHTRLVTKSQTYPEYWTAEVSYGSRSHSYNISRAEFGKVCLRFGVDKPRAVKGLRLPLERCVGGDGLVGPVVGPVVAGVLLVLRQDEQRRQDLRGALMAYDRFVRFRGKRPTIDEVQSTLDYMSGAVADGFRNFVAHFWKVEAE